MGTLVNSPFFPTSFQADKAKSQNLIGQKLKTARKTSGLNQSHVVESLQKYDVHIGVAAYSRWEQGTNMPNPYQFLALCKVLHIDNPLSLITEHQNEVSLPVHLNAEGVHKVKTYITDLESSGKYSPESKLKTESVFSSNNIVSFPVSIMKASAGTGQYLDENDFEYIDIPEEMIPAGADFGVYVSGDSMTPVYQDGQLVFVRQTCEISDGEIGLFILDGEGFIKKFQLHYHGKTNRTFQENEPYFDCPAALISLNPKYAPRILTEESEFRIVGKIL